MKKQKGFTLIELMVVMAIIAILATAGLSAYTGYIKKSRDTKRIEDVRAINTIIQGSLSANGSPPASMAAVVAEANNGQMITDPLGTTAVCYTNAAGTTTGACGYTYSLCDDGAGYLITAHFESKGNAADYTTTGGAPAGYHVGSCTAGATGTTILVNGNNWMTSDLGGFYQWNRKIPGWSGSAWDGTGPYSGDPCPAGFHMPSSGDLSALTLPNIATLGLTMKGGLAAGDGSLFNSGTYGYYWSGGGSYLGFNSGGVYVVGNDPAYGFSVRCLQD